MKVLFVRSGNRGEDPITARQGLSLREIGIEVSFFDVIGRGLTGYAKNIRTLRKSIKRNSVDLIHAHYSFCGFTASVARTGKPVITSLMGSEVLGSKKLSLALIRYFAKHVWWFTIVKSNQMKTKLKLDNVEVIPNGIDLAAFPVVNKETVMKKLGWDRKHKHVLFGANPDRPEKNFQLARQAIEIMEKRYEHKIIATHYLDGIEPVEIYKYYAAADVLLLTSSYEGSPNVVKEGMACNCPIVSTDVGDVAELIKDTEGCYITSFDPVQIADCLMKALSFARTNGRKNIQYLESNKIAVKLKAIYEKIILENDKSQ